MTISLVPAFLVMSFDSSFYFLAAKYLHDLSPYLVVSTLGKDKTYSWRLRLYVGKIYRRDLKMFLVATSLLPLIAPPSTSLSTPFHLPSTSLSPFFHPPFPRLTLLASPGEDEMNALRETTVSFRLILSSHTAATKHYVGRITRKERMRLIIYNTQKNRFWNLQVADATVQFPLCVTITKAWYDHASHVCSV